MSIGKILITGSQGYIGSRLSTYLAGKGYQLLGLDAGYFKDCNVEPFNDPIETIQCDIRDLNHTVFDGVDSVVHLAALSNDPLGEFNESLTNEINYEATIQIAKMAMHASVRRFIFLSSQSMYGISNEEEADEDLSEKHPITAYAETKWRAEQELFSMDGGSMTIASLRPSTVFGYSPRLRGDIVFNNLTLQAYSGEKITIHSDGTPWRPVIHILDVCHAIECLLNASAGVVNRQAFNLGIKGGNYKVIEIAKSVSDLFGGREIVVQDKSSDPRSYKISFNKIFKCIPSYSPEFDLAKGGFELVSNLQRVEKLHGKIDAEKTVRLKMLKRLIESERINSSLRWTNQ